MIQIEPEKYSIEQAIEFFEYHLEGELKYHERPAINTALSALREKLERERGCGFCDDKRNIRGTKRDDDCMIIGVDAVYCPKCGKKLINNNEKDK